jgi:hypothetical protein
MRSDHITPVFCKTAILQVDLSREIVFRNSKLTFSGVPIIASNMDTVGTFQMAQTLAKVTKSEGCSSLLITGTYGSRYSKAPSKMFGPGF